MTKIKAEIGTLIRESSLPSQLKNDLLNILYKAPIKIDYTKIGEVYDSSGKDD